MQNKPYTDNQVQYEPTQLNVTLPLVLVVATVQKVVTRSQTTYRFTLV